MILRSQIITPGRKQFETYTMRQDSLFKKAYQERDTKTYEKLLADLSRRYHQLDETDRKLFSAFYASTCYNLSCAYALLNDKDHALEYLDKSIKAGYINYNQILVDSDLKSLHGDSRFGMLLAPLREIGDYLYILKKAGKYNKKDPRPIPQFTYQPANDPNLVALRKAFNLDSVAGKGNEVSQIISLLHWIHNVIPHEGTHGNPVVKNAMSMMAVCRKDARGLNCRGLATVLNECYLAMGFRSRFVSCLPKDSLHTDLDSHVINMVYARSLKKWIWIDPTNDAYVMDETGTLLGLNEVRDRLIHDQTLIVNPDANWNHKVSEIKEEYLSNYMAKNLYILECPLHSEYDSETAQDGKKTAYITLLPLDYFKQSPDKTETGSGQNNYSTVFYKTNNPDLFWQAPAN